MAVVLYNPELKLFLAVYVDDFKDGCTETEHG